MSFHLILNGQARTFDNLAAPVTLAGLIAELALKGDRVAVEHNGAIVERSRWPNTPLTPGDRLEIVHFVGGGSSNCSSRGANIRPLNPTPRFPRR